jgi:hypothetical protein
MNFNSIFEELNKLYEEDTRKEEEVVEEGCVKEELTEAAEDEVPVEEETPAEEAPAEEPAEDEEEIEIVDDEPKQLILECDKCGALVIKSEADIVVDEASDLVNVEDECAFCEETAGYKIIGAMLPYETAEEAEEEVPVEEPEVTEEDEATEVVDEPAVEE